MQNYSKIGGVLSIVAGGFGVLWLIVIVCFLLFSFFIVAEPDVFNEPGAPPDGVLAVLAAVYIVMGLFYVIIGVLAIVGGVFAIKKKYWGWSLAGAIAATVIFLPCGIPAIIFVSLGRSEFSGATPPAPAAPAVIQT
jgi:hypothetical protein